MILFNALITNIDCLAPLDYFAKPTTQSIPFTLNIENRNQYAPVF